MKVLMVASWYSAKNAPVMTAGVFHYEQSMALKPYCDMALFYPYDMDLEEEFSKCEEKGLLTYRAKGRPGQRFKGSWIFDTLHEVRLLKKVCDDFRPDVIHAHCCLPAGRAAVLFGKLYGYPVVITEHSPMEHMQLDSRSVRMQMHATYKHSSANICVSADSRDRLLQQFPDCRFQVIYNGIMDPASLPADGESYARKDKLNACIIAAFYSLDIKGYQYLLPAIRTLKDRGLDIALHICGGGEYLEHYKAMARELDIADNCIFYGQCSKQKVYSILAQMDFSISASIYECSGVSVEEAMLLGKPLVVTRSGGANSLVTEDTAIVVDRGSTEAIVEGIAAMAGKLPEFDSETIRQYARNNFHMDCVSQNYAKLYKTLTEKKA